MDSDDREPALENDADDGKSDRSSELRVDLQNAEFPFKAFSLKGYLCTKRAFFVGTP